MSIPLFWLVPIASVLALIIAFVFFKLMMREDEGTDQMKKIAKHVRTGAMAYLKQQYKVVGIIFIILTAESEAALKPARNKAATVITHAFRVYEKNNF